MKARKLASLILIIATTAMLSPSLVLAGGDQVNRPPYGNPTTSKPPSPPRTNPQAPGK